MMNAGQNVQAAAGGVKFGALVVFSGEAQCDTAQNATTLGDVAKLLINLAQMQAGQDPNAAALIKSVSVTTSGTVVKISASLPEDVFRTMLHPQSIRRMYQNQEAIFYYLTLYNENYAMPAMPEDLDPEGVLRGLYRFQAAEDGQPRVHLFGSGPILNEALRAQRILAEKYEGASDVWGATIDYMKVVADQIAPWLPGRMETLGTDGFGRSDNREYLRRHFEINAESIAAAALSRLARDGQFPMDRAIAAFGELGVNTEKVDAARA